ncbi:glucose 1-dehydrogenase [Photorhabdus aegyptia]|uniref:glucose 1-dehydrogenase n=1 Tax=Photorhabdus aegyptia TaxID=2805098 RepID=UPI001E33F2D0|nr:glucose 1-dehydrogenase [Photorhabdus aegyptia]MCC8457302.1 glucose 1-dehydrogenase [Photorhabdus aegyptia]
MDRMLEGKVVIVTGGASGIGAGIALAAARHGAATVIIGDITDQPREGGVPVLQRLHSLGTKAIFHRCNVTSRSEMDTLVDVATPFGGVDLMACNAGIALATDGPQISADDFHKLLTVNLDGVLFGAQAAAEQMIKLGKHGSIVATSSMGSIRTGQLTTAYSTSKAGVNMMVAALADAFGPSGIRVNAVCPGLINTALPLSSPEVAKMFDGLRERMPLRRLGEPEEIGNAVVWLGSDLASFVTGVSLLVDGGQTVVL